MLFFASLFVSLTDLIHFNAIKQAIINKLTVIDLNMDSGFSINSIYFYKLNKIELILEYINKDIVLQLL